MTTPVETQLFSPNRIEPLVDESGYMTIRTARFFEILTNDVNILQGDPIPLTLWAMNLQLINDIKALKKRVEILEAP
jgi:hypothetical protein